MLSLELIGLLGLAYVFVLYLALRSRAATRDAHEGHDTPNGGQDRRRLTLVARVKQRQEEE